MTTQRTVFLDSSALAKQYIAEPGSHYVAQYFAAPATSVRVFVSTLTYVEVIAAISRRVPALPVSALEDFIADYQEGMQKIQLDPAVVERAALLARTRRLRAADAIQLASVLRLARRIPSVVLVTADLEMIAAAQAEGLHVENPNRYD